MKIVKSGFSVLLPVLLVSFAVKAAPVTINITGKIVAAACIIDNSGSYSIDLGQTISAATMNAANSSSSWVTKNITLSNCPAGTSSVTATFSGTADSNNSAMYANATGTGYSQNVAVQLQNQTAATNVGNGATMSATIDASRNATFPLQARAYSTPGGTTVGNISTVVLMNFTYN